MAIIRLNDSSIVSLPPLLPHRKQDLYWDVKLTGFGVRVTRSFKTFVVETRLRGKTKRVPIGKFGTLTTAEARDRAKKLLAEMLDGIDPIQARAAERAKAITLAEVFQEYKERKVLREATLKIYDGAFKRCLSDWEDKQITEITKDMVEKKWQKLSSKLSIRGTVGVAQASQAMRLLSALVNFAMDAYDGSDGKPFVSYNPVKRLSHVKRGWSKVVRRQSVILDRELPAFYKGVMTLKNCTARDYLLFLLLTGLRRNEAAALRWEEVDLDSKFITIPPTRSKNKQPHALPLPDFLLKMLKRRNAANNSKSNFVFPGSSKNKDGYYVECKSAYSRVAERMGKKFSPHDLRRSFITAAEKLKIDHYALKRLLNHSSSDVTGGYIVIEMNRLREPMNEISNYILMQMEVDESASG